MKIYRSFKSEDFAWAIWKFDKSFSELSAMCNNVSLVNYALSHFKNENRRREWLAARILLQALTGAHVNITYTDTGKPIAQDNDINISISHTGNYVAVAYHKKRDIGIDIEMIDPKIFKVRKRFMNTTEEKQLDTDNEKTALLLHWSGKESFFKITGNRGGNFSDNFIISPFQVETKGTFDISYINNDILIMTTKVEYLIDDEFVFTLCLKPA